jgi:hypothetical protein
MWRGGTTSACSSCRARVSECFTCVLAAADRLERAGGARGAVGGGDGSTSVMAARIARVLMREFTKKVHLLATLTLN